MSVMTDILARLDQHTIRIDVAQQTGDDANTRAFSAISTIYETGLGARVYTDSRVQNLRNELLALLNGVAGALGNQVETGLRDRLADFEGRLNGSSQTAEDMRREIEAEIQEILDLANGVVNFEIPRIRNEIELAEEASASAGAIVEATAERLRASMDELTIEAETAVQSSEAAQLAAGRANQDRLAAEAAALEALQNADAAERFALRAESASQGGGGDGEGGGGENTAEAIAARDAAVVARTGAESAQAAARASQELAATARAAAEGAATSSQESAALSGSYADSSESSAIASETARTQASTARDGAIDARNAAGQFRDQAVVARQTAESAAASSTESAELASESNIQAGQRAAAAATSATAAASSADRAGQEASAAEASRLVAEAGRNMGEVLPSLFIGGLSDWTTFRNGSPLETPRHQNLVHRQGDEDFGDVGEWSPRSTGDNVLIRGVLAAPGRAFRITVDFKILSITDADLVEVNIPMIHLNGDYESVLGSATRAWLGVGKHTLTTTVAGAAGPQVTDVVTQLNNAARPYLRTGLRLNQNRPCVIRIGRIHVVDVTQEIGAAAARGAAEIARDAAVVARQGAEGAQSAARTSETLATQARDASQNHAGSAAESAATAGSRATDAENSAVAANSHRLAAETARSGATTARTNAESARDSAVTARQNAEGAEAGARDALSQTVAIRNQVTALSGNADFIEGLNGWDTSAPPEFVRSPAHSGGQALRVRGSRSVHAARNFAIRPGRVWRIVARAKRGNRDGSIFYAGILCRNEHGEIVSGGYRYPAANGVALSGGSMRQFEGIFRSEDLPSDAVYFQLRSICNYQQGDDYETWLDHLSLEDITDSQEVRATLLQEYLTSVETSQALAALQESMTASMGGNLAAVRRAASAIANLSGSVATFENIASVGGRNVAAGIRATSFNNLGAIAGSLLELIGDNVIARGTLSASTFVSGLGTNLIQDSEFMDGLENWTGAHDANHNLLIRRPGLAGSHPAWPTLSVSQNGPTTSLAGAFYRPTNQDDGQSAWGIAVRPNTRYCVSAYLRVTGPQAVGARCGIVYRDANGQALPGGTAGPFESTGGTDSTAPDSWIRLHYFSTSPANAVYAEIFFQKQSVTTGNTHLYVWKPQFEETHPDASEPSPWAPGTTTYIRGGRLINDSIVARHIASQEVRALLGRFASLEAANIRVGAAEIDSLQLAGRSVSTQWSANSDRVTINPKQSMDCIIMTMVRVAGNNAGGAINYSLFRGTEYIDGNIISPTPYSQNFVQFVTRTVGAGTHVFRQQYDRDQGWYSQYRTIVLGLYK